MKLVCIVLLLTVFAIPQTGFAQSFTNLLAGDSLVHWMQPDGKAVESGWVMLSDGTLHLAGRGGNIVTRREYGDFELWFDYRIAPRGNSGIKYRVRSYQGAWLGLEYQIQDDAAFPNMAGKHRTAALYDIVDRSSHLERVYKPIDEFNTGRIVVQNHRLRHWLNGRLLIDEMDCSRRYAEAVADSKFHDRQGFGRNHCGRLMLTDHGTEVWYRNLFVRSLDGQPPVR